MSHDNRSIVRARDVMRNKVVSIDGMATVREAAARMRSEQCRCLLVDKRHADDVWGIVVVQDFVKEVLMVGRSPDEVHVYEVMTKPVITVSADMDIRYAASLFFQAGIRRAPVEEKGELVGTLNLSSLILENELF